MAVEGTGEGVVNDGSAAGAASGSAGSQGATGSASSTGASGSGTPNPVTKWEDDPRAKGILSDLQKERKARQDFERKYAEHEARLAERDRQIAALTNSKPPTKEEEDEQAVRERFKQLFPHLADLTPEDVQALRESKNLKAQVEAAQIQQSSLHAKSMFGEVHAAIAKELGELTPRQKQRINALYVAEAEASADFLARHDAGDKTLIAEFVKGYLEDTAEPVRRKVTATEVNRNRVVPDGGNRSVPARDGKPIDVKSDKDVMDFIMESRRGQFKR